MSQVIESSERLSSSLGADASCGGLATEDCLTPITPFKPPLASKEDYVAFAAFRNRIRAEELPDDPPIPVAEYTGRLQQVSPAIKMSIWVCWNAARTKVLASGGVDYSLTGDKSVPVNMRIAVLPEVRRHGIGRRLLTFIAEVAQREDLPLMFAQTSGRMAAGEAFMTRLGATKGLESHIDRLDLAELDPDVVKGWVESGGRRAEGFELLFWSGVYPEEHIQAIAALHNVINHQPRGSLGISDIDFTPDHIRAIEHRTFRNGAQRWSLYAREKATGQFAGFTQVFWHPNRPALLHQSFTGVFPEYRNRGLGRWLKAAMLEKIMRERPQVTLIRTDNANSNAAMLRVNALFGFKPDSSSCKWQVETSKIVAYLAAQTRGANA